MNNKPNDPEKLFSPSKYSLWADLRVNGWLLFAIVMGLANDLFFHHSMRENFRDWPVGLLAMIEIVPLLAVLIWARSMARWIRSMDELHRSIALEAWLFAACSTLVFLSLWPLLDRSGISAVVLKMTNFHLEALDKPNLPLTLCLLCGFYIVGHIISSRPYK